MPDHGDLKRHRSAVIAIALWLGAPCVAWAQDAFPFINTGGYISAIDHVRWLDDPDETYTPETALAAFANAEKPFVQGEWIEMGFRDATSWFALPIQNASSLDHMIVEFRNPRMSYVDCYVPDGEGGFIEMLSGSQRPFDVRPINYTFPAFPIELAPGESTTVLFRVKNIGDWRVRLYVWPSSIYYNHIATAHDPSKITIGAMAFMALFQLLVFISLREKAYLYLSFFIISWLGFLMANTGVGKWLIWQDFPWLTARASSTFMILMCASFVIFSMSYLESAKITPRLYKIGQAFMWVAFAILAYNCLTDNLFRMNLNRGLGVLSFVVITLLLIGSLRKGSRQAWFFLASWLLVFAGGSMIVLLSLYVVSAQWVVGTSFINIMFSTSILLWSFELTGRVKERAAERRRMLEQQVKERTKELEQALAEVKTLSGLLPICSHCKMIRDDTGNWGSVEGYIASRTDADFTHGICPDCLDKHFGGLGKRTTDPEVTPSKA